MSEQQAVREAYEQWSDDELRERIFDFKTSIRTREETNRIEQRLIDRYQEIIDQRALDAFWAAHQGLRLNIGDRVMITEEAVNWYAGPNKTPSTGSIGKILTITELKLDGRYIVAVAFGVQAVVSLEIAQGMRQAFLDQEKA